MTAAPVRLREPMELGQIVDRAIGLYRRNFVEFVAIAAITLPADIAGAVISAAISDLPLQLVAGIPVTIVSLILTLIATAAIITSTDEIDHGLRPDFGRAYQNVLPRLPGVLGTALLSFVLVALCAITIIGIPFAIYLLVRWAFFPQVAIIEDIYGRDALSRSAELVRGSWWRVLGILIVLWLLGGIPTLIVSIIFSAAPIFASALASSVASILVLPFAVCASTLLYFDLHSREQQRVSTP